MNEKTKTVDVKLFFGAAKPKEKTGVQLPKTEGPAWPQVVRATVRKGLSSPWRIAFAVQRGSCPERFPPVPNRTAMRGHADGREG